MSSTPKNGYPLERSFLGSSRLYLLHWLWQRLLGHLLHPCIPRTENMKIADIACGTGIWLLDLAKELAESNISAQLDGYDISTEMYPPSGWLPQNVSLNTLDIFQSIPQTLKGQYDVVHVRLLCLVIVEDPTPVLDNLLELLKPGGYIQWDESDFGRLFCTSSDPGVSCDNLERFRKWVYDVPLNRYPNFDWILKLGEIFEQKGMKVLQDQTLAHGKDISYAWMTMHMMGYEELIKIAAQGSKSGRDMLEQAAEETRRGGCLTMDLVSVVGRKVGGS